MLENEPDDSISDSSKEDNTITNVEASINDATQEESIDKDNGTTGNWSQPANLKVSRELSNSLTTKGPRTSRRHKKPPTTKRDDFLW